MMAMSVTTATTIRKFELGAIAFLKSGTFGCGKTIAYMLRWIQTRSAPYECREAPGDDE
eukprot:CAMPEP_0119496018 /NCGR_PEP_ID=MMETSP1344-20130328/19485_1 /TAXON_ID=236787 /ORGANISM="Florenciella parvula, Strain CCMP2471" /LENGTH=58 /DNA_ID=CAMNT_0007531663 /DNA_START=240 /DNA_END=413 /DNA_ORIENTATION=+